jgi:DNA repair protein SbcC/Rad50
MRPLRLLLEGFGCYRQRAEADFSDVEFFALVGPTGSGKSTLIDGLCFALYGTVPRWGKENAIADALAPAANACRVGLVFEVAGQRYAAVRALSRDKQGRVHTKEARLERLDPAVDPGAPVDELLAGSLDKLAEGPDPVTSRVEELLGLSYQHFIQSVLLPQGRFSRFLQAKATERQKLLVELLAFGVYEEVGKRARERARLAAEATRHAERERGELAGATAAAEAAAAARVDALTSLAATVDTRLTALGLLTAEAGQAARAAGQGREESGLLAAVCTPAEVSGLAERISRADGIVAERLRRADQAAGRATSAEAARDGLPDRAATERLRDAHVLLRELAAELAQQEKDLAAGRELERAGATELAAAEESAERAQAALEAAQRAHAGATLAGSLVAGEDCPVCLRPVTERPHHAAPAGLASARAAADAATKSRQRAGDAHAAAAREAAVAAGAVTATRERLDRGAAYLDGAPDESEVAGTLAAIAEAEAAFRQARKDAEASRAELAAAEKGRAALADEERGAWARLRAARDSVVALGAPAVEDAGLAGAWAALTAWAGEQHSDRAGRQPELDGQAEVLRRRVDEDTAGLARLLAKHGVGGVGGVAGAGVASVTGVAGVAEPTRVAAAVAAHRERAAGELAAVRQALKRAAKLDERIRACREEEQVAGLLGQMLQARRFEAWLCSEALDSLVAEASVTLMELSGGQYQLGRDERNELTVIDFEDAGASRPVHTLSGGETFQASLALALALSRQVVGLSAGMRDLNSMFLDEGFGTLDEDTLETVAITLERLAADSDRMVGIITHVPTLAERVPVRFVVSRTGTGSSLRKERVS